MGLVDDIAEIFVRVVAAPWEGALVSDMSTRLTTTDEIASAIRRVAPEVEINVDGSERVAPSGGFDIDGLVEIIGALPETSIDDGMAATILHFRELHAKKLL